MKQHAHRPIGPTAGPTTTSANPSATPWLWIGAALLAHTGWGIYPVLGRYMQTVSGLPSLSILVVGGLPMLALMFIYVLPRYGGAFLRARVLWLLAAVVVVRSVTNLLSARFTMAIYVQLITLMTPFIVVMLSLLLLREPVPRFTKRAISISFLGALLMLSSDISRAGVRFSLAPTDWLGIGLALTSSISLAAYMLVIRKTAQNNLPGEAVLIFQSVVILCFALPVSLLTGEDWAQWSRIGPQDWAVVIAYIVFVIFAANGLQIGALRHLGAPLVSSMMAWRLVSTILLGSFLLGEQLTTIWQMLGAGLVLVTITWYLWQQRTA